MKKVSIIIPLYNGAQYIETTLQSLLNQTYRELEIIVSDDASTDDGREIVKQMQSNDDRIILLHDEKNRGTLGARKAGVTVSTGDYAMLIDQDDELTPNAVGDLIAFAEENPADIYHFTARVVPENEAAQQAAEGMQAFLTPKERVLKENDILSFQVSLEEGFDWQLHHKLYDGDLLRKAYSLASNERLLQSDDLYMSFVLASLAGLYRTVPNAPFYLYFLGRGDTFGTAQNVNSVIDVSKNNSTAYRLIKEYAESQDAPNRNDWTERLIDAQRCLVDHPMNEWIDVLDYEDQPEALMHLLADWSPEFIGAELWRFTRDAAYDYLVHQNDGKISESAKTLQKAKAEYYRDIALSVEKEYHLESNLYSRYRDMRYIAMQHLRNAGLYHESKLKRGTNFAIRAFKRHRLKNSPNC